MKSAVIAAVVSALVASVGTAAATSYISGRSIRPHSIPANRLTRAAVKALTPTPRQLATAVSSTIDYEQTTGDVTDNPQTFTAACPAGDVAISGGYQMNAGDVTITQNIEVPDGSGWQVGTKNPHLDSSSEAIPNITVYVSCEPSG